MLLHSPDCRPCHKANNSTQMVYTRKSSALQHSFVLWDGHSCKGRQPICPETRIRTPDDDNRRRRRQELLRAQRDLDQVPSIHADGRHGAPRARRQSGRGNPSAAQPPCESGRRPKLRSLRKPWRRERAICQVDFLCELQDIGFHSPCALLHEQN